MVLCNSCFAALTFKKSICTFITRVRKNDRNQPFYEAKKRKRCPQLKFHHSSIHLCSFTISLK